MPLDQGHASGQRRLLQAHILWHRITQVFQVTTILQSMNLTIYIIRVTLIRQLDTLDKRHFQAQTASSNMATLVFTDLFVHCE